VLIFRNINFEITTRLKFMKLLHNIHFVHITHQILKYTPNLKFPGNLEIEQINLYLQNYHKR